MGVKCNHVNNTQEIELWVACLGFENDGMIGGRRVPSNVFSWWSSGPTLPNSSGLQCLTCVHFLLTEGRAVGPCGG